MTRFPITTLAEATAALEYFNAFHDGFIRELAIRSHDHFPEWGVHAISGRLDLDILFAHYNYLSGEPPADQSIRARFTRVRGLVADFPLAHGEWSIDRVTVERRSDGLIASIMHHRLVEGAWTTREGLRFVFESGQVEELFGSAGAVGL